MGPISFDHIPPFYTKDAAEPHGVNVIVETARGSRNKFAYKQEYGVMELRRILRSGMEWPCDFGFIPCTLAEDGDAIDVALLIDEGCFPGCLVRARLLGVIGLIKNGEVNDRLLACPVSLPGSASVWDSWRGFHDIPPRTVREIEAFLSDYQTFEGHQIELTGHGDEAAAMELVRAAHRAWQQKNTDTYE